MDSATEAIQGHYEPINEKDGIGLAWTSPPIWRRVVAWLVPFGSLAPFALQISCSQQDQGTDFRLLPSGAHIFLPAQNNRREHRGKYRMAMTSERATCAHSLPQSADSLDCA